MTEIPNNQFGVVYADPPWKFKTRTPAGEGRSAQAHYPCMETPAIKALWGDLALDRVVSRDCALILWATWPFLTDAIDVLDVWGFKYKSGLPWLKIAKPKLCECGHELKPSPIAGTGFMFRGTTEPILVATRGAPKLRDPANGHVLTFDDALLELNFACLAPRREHSRKPDDVLATIEGVFNGPGLELFSQGPARPGWHRWGNRVGKYDKQRGVA